MNPTVMTRRHMAKLASLRKQRGPKPARTYEEIILASRADPQSRKRLRAIHREFQEGPTADF